MFNTTYVVEYGLVHKKAVLRLNTVNPDLLMGFEENLMKAEVHVYREQATQSLNKYYRMVS